MHPILFRLPFGGDGGFPIFSYGVMLGLAFVVGWYLTLGLAERDGLPREIMANCYVVTAISAVVGARLLYVLTNLGEFHGLGDIFELRSGGMVAYGGFLGGFLGSWGYLSAKDIPLIPWADVAVPSLASGLLITRVGCYLYGCDFGRPLTAEAPAALQSLGTFPRWPEGLVPGNMGSPAWAQHVQERGLDIASEHSLAVHPTQLYESLTGLVLLVVLLLVRKRQIFRGQIFLLFTFLYGIARFGLEFLRDDAERGAIPPSLAPHILFTASLAIFAVAFAFGIARSIKAAPVRVALQAFAFVPPVLAYLAWKPAPFAIETSIKLSTSQFIALVTGTLAAVFFAMLYESAKHDPVRAMALPKMVDDDGGPVVAKKTEASSDPAPPKRRKRAGAKRARPTESAATETESEETGETKERDSDPPPKNSEGSPSEAATKEEPSPRDDADESKSSG